MSREDQHTFFDIVMSKVVQRNATQYNFPLCLDQAAITCTNDYGHRKHCDNVTFQIYYRGVRLRQEPEDSSDTEDEEMKENKKKNRS